MCKSLRSKRILLAFLPILIAGLVWIGVRSNTKESSLPINDAVSTTQPNSADVDIAAAETPNEKEPDSTLAAPTAVFPSDSSYLPKDAWVFAGYTTPESGLKSAAWAMTQGDAKTFLSALTDSERTRLEQLWRNKAVSEKSTEIQALARTIDGIRIVGRRNVSRGEVILHVMVNNGENIQPIRMERMGNDWKFAGSALRR
jgi:hypothetical protein